MPIDYKKGDLIEAFKAGEVEAIAHQANCQNTMGSGVALAIKQAFPEAYAADCQTTKGDYDKLGSLSWVVVPTNDPKGFGPIFNLYGQFNYGREKGVVYTDLAALEKAMTVMKLFLDAGGHRTVGLPMLGCGLGGADWDDVEDIILRILGTLEVTVYIKE